MDIKKESYNFEDLREILKILRSPDGCPWDREQTHESIRNEFIEEVYEAVEAIDTANPELLCEELGDVLLEVMFHSRISEEAGGFNLDDVCDGICKKLILRHPHVFGDATADSVEQVLSNWEDIKIKEKGLDDPREYLESAAKSLPALLRAAKIYKRAIKRGLVEAENCGENLESDIKNIAKINSGNTELFETIGRVLFNIAGLASELDINAEHALYDYSEQFIKRILTK